MTTSFNEPLYLLKDTISRSNKEEKNIFDLILFKSLDIRHVISHINTLIMRESKFQDCLQFVRSHIRHNTDLIIRFLI